MAKHLGWSRVHSDAASDSRIADSSNNNLTKAERNERAEQAGDKAVKAYLAKQTRR